MLGYRLNRGYVRSLLVPIAKEIKYLLPLLQDSGSNAQVLRGARVRFIMELQCSRIPCSSVGICVDRSRLIPRLLSIPQRILSFPGHFKVPRKLL